MGEVGILIFFKRALCSAIAFKTSRRGVSIDVAVHGSTLKNYQNTYYPRFSFITKTGITFPKTGAYFLLWTNSSFYSWGISWSIKSYSTVKRIKNGRIHSSGLSIQKEFSYIELLHETSLGNINQSLRVAESPVTRFLAERLPFAAL